MLVFRNSNSVNGIARDALQIEIQVIPAGGLLYTTQLSDQNLTVISS